MIVLKSINIKNHPYYFLNDMINIKKFDPNWLNKDKTSFRNTDAVIYHIKYITMKSLDHKNIDCKNSVYLVFINVDGYIINKSDENNYFCFYRQEQRSISIPVMVVTGSVFGEDSKYKPFYTNVCMSYKNATVWKNWRFRRN